MGSRRHRDDRGFSAHHDAFSRDAKLLASASIDTCAQDSVDPLRFGRTTWGNLTTDDPLLEGHGPSKRFEFTAIADGLVTLSFKSYDFDALANGYTIITVSRYTGGDNERVFGSMNRNWLFGYHGALDERWDAEVWIHTTGRAVKS